MILFMLCYIFIFYDFYLLKKSINIIIININLFHIINLYYVY